MLNQNRWLNLSILLVLGISVLAQAQEKNAPARAKARVRKTESPKRRSASKALSPGQVLVLRFDRAAPQIGDPLPDVKGFDAGGKEFNLRSLKGHYTVLTFGCLT